MFITKKKFNEAIKNAKDEEHRFFEQREDQISRDRYYDEHFKEIYKRIDRAFNDIDRRISELEERERKTADNVAVRPRY